MAHPHTGCTTELSFNIGIPVAMEGVFDSLGTGTHTVSMWVRSSGSSGTSAMWDPGCWNTDHVLMEEFGPAR